MPTSQETHLKLLRHLKENPDVTQAREKLNWQPKVQLNEGLPHTIEYFREL